MLRFCLWRCGKLYVSVCSPVCTCVSVICGLPGSVSAFCLCVYVPVCLRVCNVYMEVRIRVCRRMPGVRACRMVFVCLFHDFDNFVCCESMVFCVCVCVRVYAMRACVYRYAHAYTYVYVLRVYACVFSRVFAIGCACLCLHVHARVCACVFMRVLHSVNSAYRKHFDSHRHCG